MRTLSPRIIEYTIARLSQKLEDAYNAGPMPASLADMAIEQRYRDAQMIRGTDEIRQVQLDMLAGRNDDALMRTIALSDYLNALSNSR